METRSSSTVKPPVTRKHVLEFGKHKGKSIQWILDNDPSYIVWMKDNNVLNIPDDIYEDAIGRDFDACFHDEWGRFTGGMSMWDYIGDE